MTPAESADQMFYNPGVVWIVAASGRAAGGMTRGDGATVRQAGQELVGRDRELAELVASLEDAVAGQERLLLIAGEPGIGKTRLAEQLARQAAERGARVAWGRCWEGGGAPPYWPWAQIVRAVVEGRDEQTLAAWLGPGAALVAQLAPDLAARLGGLAAGPAPAIDSEAARFYLFEAAASFLKRASVTQPLVLVFDDLHAADDPSLLLLKYLARDRRGGRLLLVGTYRDTDVWRAPGVGEVLPDLVREGQLTTLRGLTHDDVRAMIGGLASVTPSEATVQAVLEATDGNPLFVREAVRLLAATGALDQPDRPAVPIPSSVRAIIQQRLAPLSSDAVQALAAAAVVGRDFELALLGPAVGRATDDVLRALAEAIRLGLVVEDDGRPGRYRFAHSLMREVIYDTLPLTVRAELHRAVGEAIERQHGADSDTQVAALARHFGEAASLGEAGRALAYARRAGDRAMRAYGYEDAAAAYQRALQVSELAGPDEALRCDLLLSLGAAQVRAGRYAQAKETHLAAAAIARTHGMAERLARAALGFGEPQVEGGLVNHQLVALLREALAALSPADHPLRARLLARLSVELTFSEEAHLSNGLSLEAVEIARRLGDVASLGHALNARWMAVWGPDGLEERAALAAETVERARAAGDRDLELLGRAQRASTALESGDLLAAEDDLVRYTRLADELRVPACRWTATTMQATRALLLGAFEQAERLIQEGLALQPERQNARWAHANALALLRWEQGRLAEERERWRGLVERFPRAAFARGWLALAEIASGNLDEARQALRLMAEQLPVRPRSGLWMPGMALAALVAGRLDDAEAAERLYPVLRPYAHLVAAMTMEHPVICFGAASLHLGLLAAAAAHWDDAERHFEAAMRMHERLRAAPFLARTRAAFARMLLRRGRPGDHERARALLDQATEAARAIGMSELLAEIVALGASGPAEASASTRPAAAPAPADARGERFQREGEFWTVAYDDKVVRLKDSKGLRQIALLLARPGREIPATDLEAQVGGPADASAMSATRRVEYDEVERRADLGDAGELLDAEARAAYKARLDELAAEIDEADAFNDPVRAEQAREERELLIRELARAVGLGGRARRAASHAERARLNATRAIRAAMANLAREHPALGQHLVATIRTGRYCSYTPDPRAPVRWAL